MSSGQESELVRLKQLLREANERAERERERAERERERADEERERAERESERADEERMKTRRTTLEEYIRACHTHLSKQLLIQTDKSLSTQGSITSPRNKPCPALLKPWTDFPVRQQQLFDRIYTYIPQDEELFSPSQYLTELGKDLCDRPLASEKDLEMYQRSSVERPTTHIISELQKIEEARREFNLGGGIIFENHANTLSDSNEDVQISLQDLQISRKGKASSSNPKPRNADQICVYKKADGTRSLCMIVEYKPPHKLSILNLRAGLLRADKGSLNVPEDVINRTTIPTDPEEKFVYYSEWLTAAALTQTYAYMIETGLEYGKLATGQADVFLRVKEDEADTLYYHLAEPSIEAEAESEVDVVLFRTAVGQTLTFCLMALDSKPRGQEWRAHALKTAYHTAIDYEAVLREIPVEEGTLTPPPSIYHARIHSFERSPIKLRPRKPRKAGNRCSSADKTFHKDPKSPSTSSDETSDVETPSKPRVHTTQCNTGQVVPVKSSQAAEESDAYHRQYCTQACLLGLVRKLPLDDTCPNFDAHRAHGAANHHALGRKSLTKRMLSQLTQNLDNGCEPLGKQGACGALFRLTLESHGYTFVAKGTVTAFIGKLKHECLIYRHLSKVQGELIPVYLGNISLVRPYFLDLGVRIVHMLLMSWAGEQARKDLMLAMGQDLTAQTNGAVVKMLSCGVEHRDIRPPNVLWNPEIRNVVLVDFERSEILKKASMRRISSRHCVNCG